MDFKTLHHQEKPLLIHNVWDVTSAKIAATQNAQAIGTSSSAIAALLGYNDGEEISFSELAYMVKRIVANTKLPLSVDLEAGYSRNASEIIHHIKELINIGVVGINIEDSIIVNGKRSLVAAESFSKLLSEIIDQLEKDNLQIFINVRIDTFLLGVVNTLEATKRRIKLYEKAGVSGIFIPCIEQESAIKQMVESTKLPINVMSMPKLPNFETLQNLGVKRISMGNFLFDAMYAQLEKITAQIISDQSFKSIF
ncbi:isocitrate lyase/PEP mutase family protein [Kordia sp.]|uniref:isocitrate lyase/PEP mutase family protein n=1 Tax=Kordia sp. TaxID=1965332 RepID=UPI003B5908D7